MAQTRYGVVHGSLSARLTDDGAVTYRTEQNDMSVVSLTTRDPGCVAMTRDGLEAASRAEKMKVDPPKFSLVQRMFGTRAWRERRTAARESAVRAGMRRAAEDSALRPALPLAFHGMVPLESFSWLRDSGFRENEGPVYGSGGRYGKVRTPASGIVCCDGHTVALQDGKPVAFGYLDAYEQAKLVGNLGDLGFRLTFLRDLTGRHGGNIYEAIKALPEPDNWSALGKDGRDRPCDDPDMRTLHEARVWLRETQLNMFRSDPKAETLMFSYTHGLRLDEFGKRLKEILGRKEYDEAFPDGVKAFAVSRYGEDSSAALERRAREEKDRAGERQGPSAGKVRSEMTRDISGRDGRGRI